MSEVVQFKPMIASTQPEEGVALIRLFLQLRDKSDRDVILQFVECLVKTRNGAVNS